MPKRQTSLNVVHDAHSGRHYEYLTRTRRSQPPYRVAHPPSGRSHLAKAGQQRFHRRSRVHAVRTNHHTVAGTAGSASIARTISTDQKVPSVRAPLVLHHIHRSGPFPCRAHGQAAAGNNCTGASHGRDLDDEYAESLAKQNSDMYSDVGTSETRGFGTWDEQSERVLAHGGKTWRPDEELSNYFYCKLSRRGSCASAGGPLSARRESSRHQPFPYSVDQFNRFFAASVAPAISIAARKCAPIGA